MNITNSNVNTNTNNATNKMYPGSSTNRFKTF